MPAFCITGSTEAIRDLLCGPQQHAEHMKGWRFHLYVRDSDREAQLRALMAEVRRMSARTEITQMAAE